VFPVSKLEVLKHAILKIKDGSGQFYVSVAGNMKGMSFQNGVEFKLNLDGESWQQGGTLSGSLDLNLRNPGASLPEPRVLLVETTDRKLKAKSADAFQVLAEHRGLEAVKSFQFALPPTARISDKAGSLYVLYGSGDQLLSLGLLRLNVLPHHYVQDWMDLLRTQFRFALKKLSHGKKGFVEAEFDPPSAKEWAQLDTLNVHFKWEPPKLISNWVFNRAEVDGLKAGLQTKITRREVNREHQCTDLVHGFNDRLNKDAAETVVNAVIEEYRGQGWVL
jgi:hypothetical protein